MVRAARLHRAGRGFESLTAHTVDDRRRGAGPAPYVPGTHAPPAIRALLLVAVLLTAPVALAQDTGSAAERSPDTIVTYSIRAVVTGDDSPVPAALTALGSFRVLPDTCSGEPKWAFLPPLGSYFPAAFRRRGIEGWAVVRFDVAPWGETGDVEVLASEPADAFGKAAARLIASARKAKAGRGDVGCVEKVLFKMPSTPDTNVQAERD